MKLFTSSSGLQTKKVKSIWVFTQKQKHINGIIWLTLYPPMVAINNNNNNYKSVFPKGSGVRTMISVFLTLTFWFIPDRTHKKRLWTSENEGLGPLGWLSITAGKSWVMSLRLTSSFISPHAQVSSSLCVLIVSIAKFDCRSWGLSQLSKLLIKYSTLR